MSAQVQARELVIAVGTAGGGRISVKQMLSQASRGLRIGFRRARAIYHGEARLIGLDEWRAMVARADALGIKQSWEETRDQHRSSNVGGVPVPREPLPDLDSREAVRGERASQERRAAADASTAGEPVS